MNKLERSDILEELDNLVSRVRNHVPEEGLPIERALSKYLDLVDIMLGDSKDKSDFEKIDKELLSKYIGKAETELGIAKEVFYSK